MGEKSDGSGFVELEAIGETVGLVDGGDSSQPNDNESAKSFKIRKRCIIFQKLMWCKIKSGQSGKFGSSRLKLPQGMGQNS